MVELELTSTLLAGGVALITSLVTTGAANAQFREQHRAKYQAERAARRLLMHPKWRLRSFRKIQSRLGGFSADELRQMLVRAGAVRFSATISASRDHAPDGAIHQDPDAEFWGLYKRNKDLFHGEAARDELSKRISQARNREAGEIG